MKDNIEIGRGVWVVVFRKHAEFEFSGIWQGQGFSRDLLAAALCAPAVQADEPERR